jgi:epoxyqueuosine reductase QueG
MKEQTVKAFESREEMLTKEVKKFALRAGADLVGIADPARLDSSPHGHPSPLRIMPGAKSLIVVAKRFPHGAVDVPHPPMDGPIEDLEVVHGGAYVTTYMTINYKLFELTYEIANFLETAKRYLASPISPTVPRDEIKWVGTISMRKAAEEAGLGEIGVNQLMLTPEFGPRARFAAVLTTAPLVIDGPRLKGKVCVHCFKCVKACPVHAIEERPADPPADYDRTSNYNRKKCIWGAAFGFYKASNCQQPPDEWANAASLPAMTALIPKYREMYPKVVGYMNQSLKVMGYPNCDACMQHCQIGVDARKRDFEV